ncbi:MAG TPA: DUF4333 domain-containing protein [Pseudonocardia sp.]|jgi:predicted component of type VI protein secretion system|nr:DUF4333 domain-containing protein [Pseudonocardia sp.]
MYPRTVRALGAALAAAALTVALSGCSTVAEEETVEDQIRNAFGAESVDCPSDLDGTVGATLTCSATTGGETADVVVTVTFVEGETINFDMEVVGA